MRILPDDSSWYESVLGESPRVAALLAVVVAIALLHSAMHEAGAIWYSLVLRLYYIPILISAYWYGAFGGVLAAIASSVAYAPHLRESPTLEAGRYAEIVFFHVIGLTVGLLATAQRAVTGRYQRAVATLERANQELRDSYEQLQRADRLKTLGEVAAGLAHEIRHPLASIRGALEIIDARSTPDSPEAEFSRLAMTEVQRLDSLVWEFLRYARPHQPDLRPTSLHDLTVRVTTLLGAEAEGRSVALRVECSDALPMVSLDALQMEQVLLNVLLNAIQASPPGSLVRICQRLNRQEAIIEVIDEGPGIPSEHLPRLFSPFFTTKEKGTGLGLAIAQRIVLAHHGRIDVTSGPGRGTNVRIGLPVRQPGTETPESVEPRVEARV